MRTLRRTSIDHHGTSSAMHLNRTKTRRTRSGFSLLLLLGAFLVSALTASAQVKDKDILFEAMKDELVRTIDRLMLADQDRPYFVEYRVRDLYGHDVRSTFGALVNASPVRSRRMAVSLRIGDYQFDNAGFLGRDDIFASFRSAGQNRTILQDDYVGLRRDLWLATDNAYKEAVQQMAAKDAYFASRVVNDTLPDFSHEEPIELLEPRGEPEEIDRDALNDRARTWSAYFRDHPDVMESEVRLRYDISIDYVLNSEGTRVRDRKDVVNLTITASTKAADGMELDRRLSRAYSGIEALPSDAVVEAMVDEMAGSLRQNREAPMLEDLYIGPVLLVDDAACEYINRVLVPNLSGSRMPLLEDDQFSGFLGTKSQLATRIGRRVMSKFLSVRDDATRCDMNGTYLQGCYDVDAQGVRPAPVTIIENGIARGLLYSRRPGKNRNTSTGHGRGFDNIGVAPSVLIVESSSGMTEDQLLQRFRRECADLGLEYGIVMRRLGEVTESSFSGGGISVISGGGAGSGVKSDGWKVYVDDGRIEPVRGLSVKAPDFRSMKDILAAGSTPDVLNTNVRIQGVPMLEGYVPASVVSPSLLLEEMEISPVEEKNMRPALLTHPYFSK